MSLPERVRTILFLCTGNYFRSRLAERLFRALAAERGLPWRALSRSLAPDPTLRNPGPISRHALEHLAALGLDARPDRDPLEVSERELSSADLIVAMNEPEHRPLAEARFRRWAERIEYLRCPDVGELEPAAAACEVERTVRLLVERLAAR